MSRKATERITAILCILSLHMALVAGCALHKENPEWQATAWEAAEEVAGSILSDYSKGCPECEYSDYRVEYVKHVYTYEDLEGKRLQIYQMNFELLAEAPENVVLAGGAEMTEDGWVVPDYPNSRFLVFEEIDEQLSYLGVIFENDCFPGDEMFTNDIKRCLEPDE